MTRLILAAAALLVLFPDAASAQSISNISWGMLIPGDDWTAQFLRGVFPALGQEGSPDVANQRTVGSFMVGLLTSFLLLLAMVWVTYSTCVQIKRAAHEKRVMSESVSPWAPARMCMAFVMMFPIFGGTGVGRAIVMQATMGSIGIARLVWAEMIKAVGLDAVPIAVPMIPGTKTIVAGIIQNELCRAVITAAAANQEFMPPPVPVMGGGPPAGSYVTWHYRLATGNSSGPPVCGTVTIRQAGGEAVIHGVNMDMTPRQQAILEQVTQGIIRPAVERMAMAYWDTREPRTLAGLRDVYVSAVETYTAELAAAATDIASQLRAAANADALRNGGQGLRNQDRLSAIGWVGAGAYFAEIARLNGATLGVLSSTPVINPPTYQNLGPYLSADVRPMMHTVLDLTQKINTHAQTTDGQDVPGGYADLFTGASPQEEGHGVLERILRSMRLNERLLNVFIQFTSPSARMWNNPFLGQIQLGQTMVLVSLGALALAGVLASTPLAAGAVAANVMTLNFTGAAAMATGHMTVQFLATPIFWLCMGLLIPGLILAYILPMLPFFFWIARVLGWMIQVIELLIYLPLWMVAHMTWGGDGLHGRAVHGYASLFSVMVTPPLAMVGLLFAIVVYGGFAWLVQMTFGVAADFVLMNGWLVNNVVGVIVLMCSFVTVHIVGTTQCFRLISLIPHHALAFFGFNGNNRVDTDSVSAQMGVVGLAGSLQAIQSSLSSAVSALEAQANRGQTTGPIREGTPPLDRTTQAATDTSGPDNSRRV